jgi:hypothetical protein
MRHLSLMKIAGSIAALLLVGLGTGCQTNSETVEPAYIVGVTPLGMRLDPIIWGALTHFDIASVDGAPPHSKSRTSVPPGQHTIVVNATSGWSGKSNSISIPLALKSGHTYMLRPTTFGGLTYAVVIDNDAGMVVARSEAPAAVAAPVPPPPPPKPDVVVSNPDGSLKTRGVSETSMTGRENCCPRTIPTTTGTAAWSAPTSTTPTARWKRSRSILTPLPRSWTATAM